MTEAAGRKKAYRRRILSIFALVVGLWLLVGGAAFALNSPAPWRWFAAAPLAVVGLFLLAQALPRLFAEARNADNDPYHLPPEEPPPPEGVPALPGGANPVAAEPGGEQRRLRP